MVELNVQTKQLLKRLANRGGIVCALFFFLLSLPFIGYAGIQSDEALFAAPLFRAWRFFAIPIGRHQVPMMNMSYNGTLKTWLYAAIVFISHPTAMWIRVPAILVGTVTILIFWALLLRVHSRRAGWAGCILLATDTSFLLTTTYDWGPVAIQHLMLVAAMFFAVRWYQTASSRSLPVAGFCCGLALWDKAVFIWVFTGMLVGLLVFRDDIRRLLTWRQTAIVACALCVGALPLIVYNLAADQKFATIRSNAQAGSNFTWEKARADLDVLRSTWNGSALFGYLANEDGTPSPRSPGSQLERASFTVRGLVGEHQRNNMALALSGALLLLPLLWRTRARKSMLFCLIAFSVAWIHMVMTGGGGAAHHAVLFWPLPHLFVAVAFAEASLHVRFGNWALAAVLGFLATGNVLVTNQYLYQLIRNGAGDVWTDAIYALADGLKQTHASQILLADWGMIDSLCVLDQDKPPMRVADDPFMAPGDSPAHQEADLQLLADPKAIWVEHTPGHEILPGVNERVLNGARRAGFDPVMLQMYYDRNGRAIFQTLQFAHKKPR